MNVLWWQALGPSKSITCAKVLFCSKADSRLPVKTQVIYCHIPSTSWLHLIPRTPHLAHASEHLLLKKKTIQSVRHTGGGRLCSTNNKHTVWFLLIETNTAVQHRPNSPAAHLKLILIGVGTGSDNHTLLSKMQCFQRSLEIWMGVMRSLEDGFNDLLISQTNHIFSRSDVANKQQWS